MTIFQKKLAIVIMWGALLAPILANAQTPGNIIGFSNPFVSLWKIANGIVEFTNSSWSLRIPGLGGSGTRCLQTDNDGDISKAAAACGSGGSGGSGGGTMATTTSSNPNYDVNSPIDSTDVLAVGDTSTTTAPYWFDPNVLVAHLRGVIGLGTTTPSSLYQLAVRGNVLANLFVGSRFHATSTTASIFPYASTTAVTVSELFATKLSNLTSNGFVKTSGGNGTLSVDTNSYLTGTGAGVTAVSVASANGFAGSSSGGATPALTLSTSVTGVLVGNGTAVSAGVDGTDFSLINALSCGAGQHFSEVTAAGVFTCTADTGSGGGVSDWNKQTNYGVLTLTPTTTIPVWIQDRLFASSSAIIAGLVTANNFVATGTAASVFPYASTTALSVSGAFYNTQNTSALLQTTATGLTEEYAGTSCTNQFVRSLSALGIATCATVGAADVSLANLTATDSTLTFSGTYNGSTARTIGLNLGNQNTWTASTTFQAQTNMQNASTTVLSSGFGATFATLGGNVGVGTTSPYTKFAVDNGTTTLNGDLKVGDVGTNAFTINTNGNVGIATTSPYKKFSVDGTISFKNLTSASGGTNDALCITSQNEVVQETTGTCDTSSRKFKKNINDLNTNFLSTLMSVRPVIYSPKEGDSAAYDNKRIGFIAEEVADASPYLARYDMFDQPRTLDDRGMMAIVWGSVQEIWRVVQGLVAKTLSHDDKIADMQSQIDVLKAEIEILKNK